MSRKLCENTRALVFFKTHMIAQSITEGQAKLEARLLAWISQNKRTKTWKSKWPISRETTWNCTGAPSHRCESLFAGTSCVTKKESRWHAVEYTLIMFDQGCVWVGIPLKGTDGSTLNHAKKRGLHPDINSDLSMIISPYFAAVLGWPGVRGRRWWTSLWGSAAIQHERHQAPWRGSQVQEKRFLFTTASLVDMKRALISDEAATGGLWVVHNNDEDDNDDDHPSKTPSGRFAWATRPKFELVWPEAFGLVNKTCCVWR